MFRRSDRCISQEILQIFLLLELNISISFVSKIDMLIEIVLKN